MISARLTWMPVLDRGCCCCSLETCCKVLGFFSVITGLLRFLSVLLDHNDLNAVCRDNTLPFCRPEFLKVAVFLICLESLICLITAAMFIAGIYQRRPAQMKPFVVYLHWQAICTIHVMVFFGVFLPIISLPFTIPIIGFIIHLLLCANSLRVKFMDVQNPELHRPLH